MNKSNVENVTITATHESNEKHDPLISHASHQEERATTIATAEQTIREEGHINESSSSVIYSL